MSRVFLRVKIRSLAAEARIIRSEERRVRPEDRAESPVFAGLVIHRRLTVRGEARAALLAYGFLRGRAYARIEERCHEPPDLERVARLVAKYGGEDEKLDTTRSRVKAWHGNGTLIAPAPRVRLTLALIAERVARSIERGLRLPPVLRVRAKDRAA